MSNSNAIVVYGYLIIWYRLSDGRIKKTICKRTVDLLARSGIQSNQ